jgi:hypothetical protein
MMTVMPRLRLLLILFLTVALDLSTPVRSEAMEALEEFEEVTHRLQGRRGTFRLVRDTVPPRAGAVCPRSPSRPRLAARAVRRAIRTDAHVRKIPPLIAEPSSAPEDH